MKDAEDDGGREARLPAAIRTSGARAGPAANAVPIVRKLSRKASSNHRRSHSFQTWMNTMQRAWSSGPSSREGCFKSNFNPEVLTNQKRQWTRIHSREDHKQNMGPASLFEQFFIVGLHPEANVVATEDTFASETTWEPSVLVDLRSLQKRGASLPTLEPQILFRYPPRKNLPMRVKDLPAFCFPGGIKPHLLERTPSMSDLNEVIYGQEHLCRDDLSFIFSLKVADNATLYGVCLHVEEIVQNPPYILGVVSTPTSSSLQRNVLVSAPRCYCVLTRVPFFELHYEMLNSIVSHERLERITQFVSEMALADSSLSAINMDDPIENFGSPERCTSTDWMASEFQINDNVIGFADQAYSPRQLEPQSPDSVCVSEASDISQAREIDKDSRKSLQCFDDFASEASGSRTDSFERMNGIYENGSTSPDTGMYQRSLSNKLEQVGSPDSFISSVKSLGSEDDVDEVNCSHEKTMTDEQVLTWAKENKNDLLQIVCGYHALSLPSRGSDVVFQPLDHFQPIKYTRPATSDLGLFENSSDVELGTTMEAAEIYAKVAAAEEALALSIWTTATVCRALSLGSILALFTGALLEKQILVICPNLGVLSATVLSVIPMIRPFQWQSLLLPVLPRKMHDFLDAPVPFIVGVPYRPDDLKMRSSNIVSIDVERDQVNMYALPQLPRFRELVTQLGPIHARLSCENSVAKRHPVYKCNEVQAKAAGQFLGVMRNYLESLCSNLRLHTITNVQSNNDKVSLLLKESFIDSFPSKDRPFIRLFVETQLFSVLSDFRLSTFELE